MTYRWREHCGPYYDDDLGYRPAGEFDEWRRRDPLPRLREVLLREGIADERELERLTTAIETEIAGAIAFAKESPFPEAEEMQKDIYCEAGV
jgi:pyruvate dehydrogenase E1 component alpha subunit